MKKLLFMFLLLIPIISFATDPYCRFHFINKTPYQLSIYTYLFRDPSNHYTINIKPNEEYVLPLLAIPTPRDDMDPTQLVIGNIEVITHFIDKTFNIRIMNDCVSDFHANYSDDYSKDTAIIFYPYKDINNGVYIMMQEPVS